MHSTKQFPLGKNAQGPKRRNPTQRAPAKKGVDWVFNNCSLRRAYDRGEKDKHEWELAYASRCKYSACPACSNYNNKTCIKPAYKIIGEWKLHTYELVGEYQRLPWEDISADSIGQFIAAAMWAFRTLLRAEAVLAVLLKPEIAAGPRQMQGSQTILLHWHAFIMFKDGSRIKHVLDRFRNACGYQIWCKPAGQRRLNYLLKPMVKTAQNWDPVARKHLITQLNEYQKKTGRKKLIWRGGLFDGRKNRWALEGAGLWTYLSNPGNFRCIPGFHGQFAQLQLLHFARKLTTVIKWSYLAGSLELDVRLVNAFFRPPGPLSEIVSTLRMLRAVRRRGSFIVISLAQEAQLVCGRTAEERAQLVG